MEERLQTPRGIGAMLRMACRILVCGLLMVDAAARCEEFRDPCDSSKTSWQIASDRAKVRIDRHERDGYEFHSGTAAEAVQFTSAGETFIRLSHTVPRSLVIDELKASLWVRGNRTGSVLAARVTLPHERDPRTGEPVSFDLRGDEYTTAQRWQKLTCQTRESLIEGQLKLIRGRMARTLEGRSLNLNDMHVSEVVLVTPGTRGTVELLLDDLFYGPIVRASEATGSVIPAAATTPMQRQESPIQIETNRLLVNGKPTFLRLMLYHDENLDLLKGIGANVAWVEHYDDHILTSALAERGIWSMAAPPRTIAEETRTTRGATGLMPIDESTSKILMWNVGTRIPPDDLKRVESWIDQLRDADRAYTSPRPIIADVIGEERRFSRYVSLLGNTRHTLHTTVPPLELRNYLAHRKNLALPDRFNWSWIQTEPSDGNVVTRPKSRNRPAIVEAEQIWLQAWTAISVGHKAIGYWNSVPLDDPSPAAEERRLALALLNAQIELLEPWLAAGKLVDTVPVSVNLKQSPDLGSRGYSFRNSQTSQAERDALLRERERNRAQSGRVATEVDAAVIESTFGRLVIPVWYEEDAQFQPGQMAAQDVSILVRSIDDARAWQVTTTAITPVDMQRVAGGMRVSLPMIDQHAFIVITTDAGLEEKLMHKMRAVRRRCGQLWVELAKARLTRVQETHAALEKSAAPAVPDGPFLLTSASKLINQAQDQLQAEQYSDAERFSRHALQLLRKLQRTHWENAVVNLTAPTASPHAVCFNTLPDHWRLIKAIGRSAGGSEENLLRSGNFEDLDTMKVDGWDRVPLVVSEPELKIAELDEDAAEGSLSLRLQSSSTPGATFVENVGPDVVIVSPSVTVRGGQIILVTGRVRVDRIARREIDGLMVSDNITGTVGALRWTHPSPNGQWETFQLIREVPSTRDVQLTFELHGEGDVRIDDVRLVALSTTLQAGGRAGDESGGGLRRNLLDFAPSFPKVNLWPGRKSAEQPSGDAQPAP